MQKKGIKPPPMPVIPPEALNQVQNHTVMAQHHQRVVVRASRLAELFAGRVKNFFHPKTIEITDEGIKTMVPESSFFSWVGEEEIIAYSRVSSVLHKKGVLWDALSIETLGGSNTMEIDGLPKYAANHLVDMINRYIA